MIERMAREVARMHKAIEAFYDDPANMAAFNEWLRKKKEAENETSGTERAGH